VNASTSLIERTRPLWLVLLVALTLIVLVPTQQAQAKKANPWTALSWSGTLQSNDIFNRATEASNRPFSPPSAGSLPVGGQSAETIIGPDGRTQILDTTTYPSRAIGLLAVNFPTAGAQYCTAFLVKPDRLVTSAYCVYDYANAEFINAATFFPGRNGDTLPYGSVGAVEVFIPIGYANTGEDKFNIGLVFLADPIGNTVGWLGYGWNGSNSLYLNHKATLRGYPTDKIYGTMWTMNGKINGVDKTYLEYTIDTFGQAGSPLYGKFKFDENNCNPCAAGVHAYSGPTENYANRITRKLFKFIKNTDPTPPAP
jgi:glutamyl endopeptidase